MSTTRLVVDLKVPELIFPHSKTPATSRSPSCAHDLTGINSTRASAQHQDHMHGVAALLRPAPPSIDLTEDDESDPNALVAASPPHRRRDFHRSHSHVDSQDVKQEISEPSKKPSFSRTTSIHVSPFKQLSSTIQRSNQKSEKKSFKAFPFMKFPPEIRNTVYKFLLTTPNAPIEFPGLTGRNAARHRVKWAKFTTINMRRQHKKIFLEILEVCRQVHDEASGIIYGCNVFKYRSNPNEGRKSVVLPTRHLQLLKHIKISVVSQLAENGQHEWVADLIKQFAKDGLRLETFELTWYGWARCTLVVAGPVCQALRLLQVSRNFVVKLAGEARMEKAMQEELEKTLVSSKVEIQRPVKAMTGEELSENEAS